MNMWKITFTPLVLSLTFVNGSIHALEMPVQHEAGRHGNGMESGDVGTSPMRQSLHADRPPSEMGNPAKGPREAQSNNYIAVGAVCGRQKNKLVRCVFAIEIWLSKRGLTPRVLPRLLVQPWRWLSSRRLRPSACPRRGWQRV